MIAAIKGLRNQLVSIAEARLKVRVVRPSQVALIFEEVYLRRFFKEFSVDCVFDVGANRGQYGEMLRSRVGYQGLIISYEPIPAALKVLREKAKKDPNWQVVPSPLDETAGQRTFNIMQTDQFSSLLNPSTLEIDLLSTHNTVTEQLNVEARTLEDEFKALVAKYGFKRPFLKMDTQGHDLAVARGGGAILSSFVGIQTELAVRRLYESAPDFVKAIEFFKARDFDLSAFVPNNEGHFPLLLEIDGIFVRRNLTKLSSTSV
jgi:FkbM family methyltransferase